MYDAIIFDVGCCEEGGRVSVPPKQFYTDDTLSHTKTLLKSTGKFQILIDVFLRGFSFYGDLSLRGFVLTGIWFYMDLFLRGFIFTGIYLCVDLF